MNKDYLRLAFLAAFSFFVQALAWPLSSGRDGYSYLYYAFDFLNSHPESPFTLMFRTPVAPFFDYFLLEILGPAMAEIFMGLVFIGIVLVLYRMGNYWGRKYGWILAGLFLVHFGWGSLFHVISNDPTVVILVPLVLWGALAATTSGKSSRFLLTGILTGLLLLTRPGIFVVFGLFPLFDFRQLLKTRLVRTGLFFAGCLPFLLGWGLWNQHRYGYFAVAPGADVVLPLARVLGADQTVKEENGANSRLLAEAVRTHLIANNPKFSGWTANQYFRANAMYFDYMVLADKTWGPGQYSVLRAVGWEAVRAYPKTYFLGVAKNFFLTFAGNLKFPVPLPGGVRVYTHKGHVTYISHGKDQWVPVSEFDFTHLPNDSDMKEIMAQEGPNSLRAWNEFARLPLRHGWVKLGAMINWLCYLFPPMVLWLLAALICWALRWRTITAVDGALLFFASLCLATNLLASLSIWSVVYEYRLPSDPVFVLVGLIGIFRLTNGSVAQTNCHAA